MFIFGRGGSDRRTCLALASAEGNFNIVSELLGHDVHINFRDRWGNTALSDAVYAGHTKIASKLYESGGRLGYDNSKMAVTLNELALTGNLESVKLHLAVGCNPK